jgi:O-antigen/teichoic acid export membrane protein
MMQRLHDGAVIEGGVRNRAAREVEGVAVNGPHNLHDVRVLPSARVGERAGERCHRRRLSSEIRIDERRQHLGRSERLVSLDVRYDGRLRMALRHFGHSIRAAWMVLAGAFRDASEVPYPRGDLLVVGGDEDLVEGRATRSRLVHPLNNRAPVEISEWFAWEAGRAVTDRDNGENLHDAGLWQEPGARAAIVLGMGERGGETTATDVLATPEAGGMAIRGGALRTLGYGLGLAMSLVSVPLLTRHLGVADFGGYVTVLSLVTIVALVADAGLTVIGVRDYAVRAEQGRRSLVANILSLRLLIATSGVILATGLAVVAGYETALVAGTVLAGAGVILASVHQTYTIPLAAELRLGVVTVLDLLRQALSVGTILVLIAVGAGLTAFLAVPIPVGIAVAAITAFAIRRRAALRPRLDRSEWRHLLRDTLLVAAASILGALFYRIAIVMMSVLSTEQETGYFGASLRVIEVIVPIPSMITASAFPILARAAVGARERLVYGMQRLFEIALILGAWTALALFVGAEPVMQFIGGDEFDPAVKVLQIQGIATAASFLFAVWAAGLWATGAPRSLLIATVGGVVSVIILTAVLAPTEGAIGAAVAMTISETLLAALAGFLLMRERHLRVRLGIVPKVALALGCGLLVSLLGLPQIALLVLATLVYFSVSVVVGAIPPDIRHALLHRHVNPEGPS